MTSKERLLKLFREHGNRITLGDALEHGLYKLTARVSDLRAEGYNIVCHQDRDHPTQNLYVLKEPPVFDETGQSLMDGIHA